MKQNLLFGCAYYLEYMPYERLEEDLEMISSAGMNVARIAESTWSTLEPQDGVFDFSYIDAVIEKTKKYHINIIIGTPTYAIPSWLAKKDGNVLEITRTGRAMYGQRQNMNLLSDTYRFHAERVIRKLMEHTAGVPHVIGFQIDNETKHYGNMGDEMQELFLEYLKQKFGTTQRLNAAFHLSYWSNSIAAWEDFPDMRGCVNAGLASEFEKFKRHMAVEFLHWQADIVNEYKREDQFITHNFDFEWKKFGAYIAPDGYSYGVQPDINHYEASKHLTIAGTDIYHPTQDELTGAEIAFGGDAVRSLKQDNYLVLECQAQAFKYWTPYPGQLRLHAYSHLASGADGILYWNWHSIHNGFETYWKGLLSHDLSVNPTYEEACKIGKEWQRIGGRICHLKKQNKIALVVDNHSHTALSWFPIDSSLSYNDVVRWMYDSLYEMNLECDIVDINALEPGNYQMLITPALYSITEDKIEQIESFVKEGGVLISSFKSFVSNEYLTVYPDALPHGMTDCFGMSYNQYTEPGKTKLNGKQVTCLAELLKPDTAVSLADYEHKYWGIYSGMTENAYGKGYAYYIGAYTEKDTLKKLYERAMGHVQLEIPGLKWPVIVRNGKNREGKNIHYFLHYSEEDTAIECPYENVTDLLSGQNYRKGDAISLSDWDVKILEEQ